MRSSAPLSNSIFHLAFKNWDIPGLFFIIFVSFSLVNKIWQWLESNHGSLVSEATARPTAPQPLPYPYLHLLFLSFSLSVGSPVSTLHLSNHPFVYVHLQQVSSSSSSSHFSSLSLSRHFFPFKWRKKCVDSWRRRQHINNPNHTLKTDTRLASL